MLTWKKVVTIDLGGWLITQVEGPGRYSTCANVVFLFSWMDGLSCVQFFCVHPVFLADNITHKHNKICLMLLMLKLLPNISIMLEQTHIVKTSVVAKQTVPVMILFI